MATTLSTNETAKPRRVRSFYTRVAALGFGLIALAGLVGLVVGIVTASGMENLTFGLLFLVVGALVTGAVWTGRGWALVLAGVLSLALLALLGPFALFGLAHPESATEFVPVVLILTGASLGLIGAVVALIQARRRTVREQATGPERLALATLISAIALAALVSVVLTAMSRTAVPVEARAGAGSMHIKNFVFAPQTYQATAGETVRVVIKNDDASLHTFTLPAAGVDVSVPPGSEKLIEFKSPAAGVYRFFCVPHSEDKDGVREGMVGTLAVE